MNVVSMQVLMDYFTDTSVAPFNRDFVEIEDPLCNDVSIYNGSVSLIRREEI